MKTTATAERRDLRNGIRRRLAPRLRLEPTLSRLAPLDGAWWPRSADPDTELPDLVSALDSRRGPITHLLFDAGEWDEHPRRLVMAGRRVRLGWSAFSPANLMIAICDNGDRLDLLVIPPDTDQRVATTAMTMATDATRPMRPQDILTAATTSPGRRN
jgi:hypothetical protein